MTTELEQLILEAVMENTLDHFLFILGRKNISPLTI